MKVLYQTDHFNQMSDIVVNRPEGYWRKLNRDSDIEYVNIITRVLDRDMNLYADILRQWIYQANMTRIISKYDYNYKIHRFIGDDDENEDIYVIALQKDAQIFINDWDTYGMKFYPDGTKIPEVNSFTELITVMSKLNPYWILELWYIFSSGRDFSQLKPDANYRYIATTEEVAAIRQKLLDIVT
jgi:hypothetical protein